MDGVGYRACAVLTRNNHTRSHRIAVVRFGQGHICARREVRSYTFEVRRHACLHLYLDRTVTRVNIVKEFLPGLTGVVLHLVIQVFGNVNN